MTVLQLVSDISAQQSRTRRPMRRPPVMVIWQMPTPHFVRVNVDGSSHGNPGLAACEVVLRGDSESILAARF